MTDLLIASPFDTGEFAAIKDERGQETQRLNPAIVTSPFPIVIRKMFDETSEIRIPATIGVVDLTPPRDPDGPQPSPWPQPNPNPGPGPTLPVPVDLAAAQPLLPATRILTVEPREVWSDEPDGYVGRHRDPRDVRAPFLRGWLRSSLAVIGRAL